MKKATTLLALALACGEAPEDDQRYDTSAAEVDAPPEARPVPEGAVIHVDPGGFATIMIAVDDDEAPEGAIGTLGQRLTIPNGYGLSPGQNRCWSGSDCIHPGSKTYQRKFYASTCTSWEMGRWMAAEIRAMANTGVPYGSANATFALTLGTKNEWRCGDNADAVAMDPDLDGALGVASITYSSSTKKIISTDVWIFTDNIAAQSGWGSKTDLQHEKFYDNAILHEILHTLALGHSDATLASVLMNAYPSSSWYSTYLTAVPLERNWLFSYQP
jgi:hypothetical protein